ncbi:MAG: hypothetical protein ACP5N1_01155 [Candidatus Woesearchaeota archaeon]
MVNIENNYNSKTRYKNKSSKKITNTHLDHRIENNILKIITITSVIIITCVIVPLVSALSITEIMYNPNGSDTGREWIEIWLNDTDGCINLTTYRFFEEEVNHKIYSYSNDYTCDYAILFSDTNKFLQDYNYLNNSYFPLYKSTFSLNNNGEIIQIVQDEKIVSQINYSQIISEIETTEGHSIEYKDNAWRNSELIGGDPGNIIEEALEIPDENLNESNSSNNYSNDEYEDYNTSDNTYNITYNNTDGINLTYNSSINTTNITNDDYSQENNNTLINNTINESIINITTGKCIASLRILTKNESIIYENGESIKFYNIIDIDYNNTNITKKEIYYSIDYWVEDLFKNKIKNTITTTNQNEKSFTPKISEEDKIVKIKSILKSINCEIINDSAEKILLIKNSDYDIDAELEFCEKCELIKDTQEDINNECIDASDSTKDYEYNSSNINNGIKPEIKIINICDKIDNNTNITKDLLATSTLTEQSSISVSNYRLINNNDINSTNTALHANKSTSQSTSRTTSMIIYESSNLENRLYAIIGLILVGLTGIILVIKKIYHKKALKKSN